MSKQGKSKVLLMQEPSESLRLKVGNPETHDIENTIKEVYQPCWHVSYQVGGFKDRQAPAMRMSPISHEEVDVVVERRHDECFPAFPRCWILEVLCDGFQYLQFGSITLCFEI